MMDWNGYREALLARVGDLGRLTPETLKGLTTLDRAGEKNDHLGAKTRELIALAVAVTTRCDGCIAVHSKAALELGASRDEIAEALGVAVALNAGAAVTYSARVLDAVEALPES
ncbi:carboxymuconolactone decarboxylase family protein [Tistrella mobilis]|uniref:carboxymuconolactone decarboxylase family protein n=1 Tax=Tistrella mobilis TaxID=171437 RepID=UPI0035576821